MRIVRTVAEARAALAPLRAGSIGLVPTMGAYHDGHLSLFRTARAACDTVVASLFVNPTQFLADEDFATYPRDEDRDAALAADAEVDLLYAPAVGEVYPPGFQTYVEVEELSQPLEGAFRPGHFRGVATVCLKLFTTIRPDRAYFGKKDAHITSEAWDRISAAHPDVPLYLYEADHGFFSRDRPDYDPDPANLARLRTLQLFHQSASGKAGESGA